MQRQANPLAAYLDAVSDARGLGLCQSDIDALERVGELIATTAEKIAAELAATSDARMVTTWAGHSERRETKSFTAEDLAEAIAEGALGELDAFGLVRATAALRLYGPADIRAAA